MTNSAALASTRSTVLTNRPERYGKQLVAHLGRRNGGQWSPEKGSGWIDLGTGQVTVTSKGGELHLHIVSRADNLPQLEGVVAHHLARFGDPDELTVTWERDTATSCVVEPSDT